VRPKGGNGNVAASVAFCLDRSVIGMGWPVPNESVTQSNDLEWFKVAATREYGDGTAWHSVWTFAEQPQLGDLVWFRSTEGRFYLAEIVEPWKHEYEDPVAIGADIVTYRKARIIEEGIADAVPGKVIACFRRSRTFQAIRSTGMLAFSFQLAGLSSCSDTGLDLYEFMSDADVENLVFVYLQVCGWHVLPGTRSATTASYEFVLVNRGNGERAVVQVKSGNTWIDASLYAGEERTFLFLHQVSTALRRRVTSRSSRGKS